MTPGRALLRNLIPGIIGFFLLVGFGLIGVQLAHPEAATIALWGLLVVVPSSAWGAYRSARSIWLWQTENETRDVVFPMAIVALYVVLFAIGLSFLEPPQAPTIGGNKGDPIKAEYYRKKYGLE